MKDRKGFTLIELLVAITIIGIIMLMVLPAITNLQRENQEKFFLNAKRVRRLIVDKMNELFKEYDGMIAPVGTGPAKYIDDSKNEKNPETRVLDELLQIGNFGGYPSITIPNGFIDNLPVGVNITGKVKDDINVLNIAYALESTMNYKGQIAKEVK